MGTIVSQITSLTIVYSTVYSGADQRKYQSSASLAFVRGIHQGLVNSPHKWPVTLKNVPIWWCHHVMDDSCLENINIIICMWHVAWCYDIFQKLWRPFRVRFTILWYLYFSLILIFSGVYGWIFEALMTWSLHVKFGYYFILFYDFTYFKASDLYYLIWLVTLCLYQWNIYWYPCSLHIEAWKNGCHFADKNFKCNFFT